MSVLVQVDVRLGVELRESSISDSNMGDLSPAERDRRAAESAIAVVRGLAGMTVGEGQIRIVEGPRCGGVKFGS